MAAQFLLEIRGLPEQPSLDVQLIGIPSAILLNRGIFAFKEDGGDFIGIAV
jgi:hypothetical protein